jgi:xyloglucan-specific endo-beta-1,4-glucanase
MPINSSRSIRRFFSVALALIFLSLVAVLTTPPTTTRAAGCSQPFCSVVVGKYWINNNLWGQGSGSGWQAIWDTYSAGNTMGWGTTWSWTGQSNSVKSYASVVLGWHWGWMLSNTGLPVQISANRNVNTGWNYSVTQNGTNTMNVAYDCWLHTIPNPSWNNDPSDEVMIWLYRSGGAGPVGTYQATVNLAGTSWNLYRGNIGWNVFSFVRTTNTTNQTLNIRDFLNHLVSRGWMSNSKYLTSVQAGTEVFIGNGRVDTNSYFCNIQ